MKKQILLSVFFLAAIIASLNSAYAQTYKNPLPAAWAAPTCGGSEYFPTIGETYNYKVSITNDEGYNGGGTYDWYVTQDLNLLNKTALTTPGDITLTAGTANDNINIKWNSTSLGSIYYVVIHYTETSTESPNCEKDNIKVFPVSPINGFWLDIDAATAADGTGMPADNATSFEVCTDDVFSAVITTAGDINTAVVEYTFGTTTLYAIIHAAGYEGPFTGNLVLSGLENDQVATISGWTDTSVDGMGNGVWTNTNLTSSTLGTDIPVTIVISNNHHESIKDQPIRIEISGTYTDGTNTFDDLSDVNGNCTAADNNGVDSKTSHEDYVIQTIKARPAVNAVNPVDFVDSPSLIPQP